MVIFEVQENIVLFRIFFVINLTLVSLLVAAYLDHLILEVVFGYNSFCNNLLEYVFYKINRLLSSTSNFCT